MGNVMYHGSMLKITLINDNGKDKLVGRQESGDGIVVDTWVDDAVVNTTISGKGNTVYIRTSNNGVPQAWNALTPEAVGTFPGLTHDALTMAIMAAFR
jgi:hypothetical protein